MSESVSVMQLHAELSLYLYLNTLWQHVEINSTWLECFQYFLALFQSSSICTQHKCYSNAHFKCINFHVVYNLVWILNRKMLTTSTSFSPQLIPTLPLSVRQHYMVLFRVPEWIGFGLMVMLRRGVRWYWAVRNIEKAETWVLDFFPFLMNGWVEFQNSRGGNDYWQSFQEDVWNRMVKKSE